MLLLMWTFSLVMVDLLQHNIAAASITWEIPVVPIIFGNVGEIRCRYHSNISGIDQIAWTWTTGKKNDLIMTGGFLSEKYKYGNKYSELRSPSSLYSTLKISNFDESDYNQSYKCGIRSINDTKNLLSEYLKDEITFENISYEYNHGRVKVGFEIDNNREWMTVDIEFDKIYPIPQCNLTNYNVDKTDVVQKNTKKIGLFYNIVFTMNITWYEMEMEMEIMQSQYYCILCNATRSFKYSRCFHSKERPTNDNVASGYVVPVLAQVFIIWFTLSSSVIIQCVYNSNKGPDNHFALNGRTQLITYLTKSGVMPELPDWRGQLYLSGQFQKRLLKQRCVDIINIFILICGILVRSSYERIEDTLFVLIITGINIVILLICMYHMMSIIEDAQIEAYNLKIRIAGQGSMMIGFITVMLVLCYVFIILSEHSMNPDFNIFAIFDLFYFVGFMLVKLYCVHIVHELHEKKLEVYEKQHQATIKEEWYRHPITSVLKSKRRSARLLYRKLTR